MDSICVTNDLVRKLCPMASPFDLLSSFLHLLMHCATLWSWKALVPLGWPWKNLPAFSHLPKAVPSLPPPSWNGWSPCRSRPPPRCSRSSQSCGACRSLARHHFGSIVVFPFHSVCHQMEARRSAPRWWTFGACCSFLCDQIILFFKHYMSFFNLPDQYSIHPWHEYVSPSMWSPHMCSLEMGCPLVREKKKFVSIHKSIKGRSLSYGSKSLSVRNRKKDDMGFGRAWTIYQPTTAQHKVRSPDSHQFVVDQDSTVNSPPVRPWYD